jgi:hypothetical protein
MTNGQQVQLSRKTGEHPQPKTAYSPIVLPAPENGFNNGLSLFADCLPVLRIDFLSNPADLYVVRSHINAAKPARMFRACGTNQTGITIGTTINLRGSPAVRMVSNKPQSLSLGTHKLIFPFVVHKPVHVIGNLFLLTTLWGGSGDSQFGSQEQNNRSCFWMPPVRHHLCSIHCRPLVDWALARSFFLLPATSDSIGQNPQARPSL